MSARGHGKRPAAAILPIAAAGSLTLAAGLAALLRAPDATSPGPFAAAASSPPAQPVALAPLADPGRAVSAPRPEPRVEIEAAAEARTGVDEVARALAAVAFDRPAFETRARAVAGGLCDRLGEGTARRELERLASNSSVDLAGRVACAELLRHVRGGELPATALGALRLAWLARRDEPRLALAAARALARFGDAQDRQDLLDVAAGAATTSERAAARTGILGARGESAAIELAGTVLAPGDGRTPDAGARRELALCALTALAQSADSGMGPGARDRCAAILSPELDRLPADDASTPRLRALLALLAPPALERSPGAPVAPRGP